ncbi:PREDICTED: olfactory receptor 5V1-like [Nanorana parkeri]|uniref:olfactory receptor 5V1-like n=1 Tax=Nanorana parkeri TaxID=125878 RepID=UPI0008546818|nr:PREDICTED: olfactory receptor 5V1-like [Nanorana parkeri]
MGQTNMTVATYFIIAGFSELPVLQLPIFLLVLLIYFLTVGGNSTILLLVCTDHRLHTPMYFFLANLSIVDISCSTITLHKALETFISGDNTVSLFGCLIQIFIYLSLLCDELLILTAMSYDRYVAICNPLQYHTVMNRKVCLLLASVCWTWGVIETIPIFIELLGFTCYTSCKLNHFFCDIVPLKKLSCSDTSILELYMLIVGMLIATFSPFLLTFISYVFIISTILRIRSSIERRKAFYTCSSHLTVVVLLYSSLIFQYVMPHSFVNLDLNKLSSLFNTALIPILNPLIYSLKNKDVKAAFRRKLKITTK